MSSSTGTKKELIDFLWEWAEANGEWSKLLINNIVASEKALLIEERQLIFDYFLQSIKFNKGLPELTINKPQYSPPTKKIELQSLSEVKGVNKLADAQIINFAKNITIIYGENGSGKTGYCRILKSLGFSYDTKNAVFSNINQAKVPQSARIKYLANEADETLLWDGNNTNVDLSSISVFNNNCVQISLGDGRGLIVSPIGFHLFNLVVDELNELSNLINKAISDRPTKLAWDVTLNTGTPQSNFISTLNDKSTEQELSDLSNFTEVHINELANSETELKKLNKDLIDSEIKSDTAKINELQANISKIELTRTVLNLNAWNEFLLLNDKLKELESKTQRGIKEIAESKGIEFYNTNEFQSFIKAAEQYIQLLNKPDYPNSNNEICIYCRQELEGEESKELLKNYRTLLNDTTQDEIAKNKKEKAATIKQIDNLSNIVFHHDTFGLNDKNEVLQSDNIANYNKNFKRIKDLFLNDKVSCDLTFDLDHDFTINYLKQILNDFIIKRAKNLAIINNIDIQDTKLKSKIAELKDRKTLNANDDEIKKVMIYLKAIARLEKNRNKFSTNSISRKTTEAREELVKQNFIDIFNDELKSLRKTSIKIELNFGTSRGHSKVQQRINSNYYLLDILSEGEQKAIALAEYLTELQLDNSKSPVIFDDPVNSLDHHIIDDVSRRLIKLSADRQVIICTHSILLFNSLLYFSKQTTFKDLTYKFYNSKTQFDRSGYITEAEEQINGVNVLIREINSLLNNSPKERSESDIASDGYGYLRSAIEVCVEKEIFKETVKRYQKNIALGAFVKVNGELINAHKDKLNEIFERSSGYIKGHSNPTEIHNEPTIAELKTDFNDFNIIRSLFLN
jgi:energy-coupling factor transporter ATP-binding protein EcfA2